MQPSSPARFCGNCGVRLFGPAFAAGQCLSCGYPITDTVSAAEAQAIATQYHRGTPSGASVPATQAEMSTDERLTRPTTFVGGASPPSSKRRWGLWLLFPLFLLLFLILFTVWHTTHTMMTANTPPSGMTPTPRASTIPGGMATMLPGTTVTPSLTPAPGGTAPPGKGTPVPSGTPSANPTATTTTGAPPSIALSNVTFSQTICLNGSLTFTVTNSGGGVLNYHVGASSLVPYTINPTDGSLVGGQSDTVHVTGITAKGTVTVSANGVANAQTINIGCLL